MVKKILIVSTTVGTVHAFLVPHIKLLQELGFYVDIAASGCEMVDELKKISNCNYIELCFERKLIHKNNVKAYFKLKSLRKNYYAVHCHTPIASAITRIVFKKRNTKILYTAHGFHFHTNSKLFNWILFYPIEKILSRNTDLLLVMNEEDFLLANKKFSTDVIKVPGVGVRKVFGNFEISERKMLKKSLDIEDDFVIILVGELNDNKNQSLAIEAMHKLVKVIPNSKLLLVGKGPNHIQYEKLIKELHLEKNIRILGYRNDVIKLLSISDILLSTSKREGLPVNIIEGMMMGLPIIASDIRGNNDLVKDNINGRLVEHDSDKISKAIYEVYKNKEISAKYSSNSLAMFERYSEKVVLDFMADVYISYLL